VPRSGRRIKVLFTEGSSTSARHTLYALGPRYVIDVLDPNPNFCLARFSRFVRKRYRCPVFATDPVGYLRFLIERLKAEHYDVVFPVHDQAYLLSRCRNKLSRLTAVPVPDFAVMERVQSKSRFMEVLAELGLPHPPTRKIHSRQELDRERVFPFYLKLPYSTAGCGVWRIDDSAMAQTVADRLESGGGFGPGKELLAQEPAPGVLCVAQSVFQHGRLVAAHVYQARALGVGGSAVARISVHVPEVVEHLRLLGEHLYWHGALMLDFFVEPRSGNVSYIEANPRIGETGNALFSGVNLPELLIQVAREKPVGTVPAPRAGTRTHSGMMALMGIAQSGGSRGALLREAWRALARQGLYAGSRDEITCPARDLPSVIPAAFMMFRFLLKPAAAQHVVNKAVMNYSLTERALQAIRSAVCGLAETSRTEASARA